MYVNMIHMTISSAFQKDLNMHKKREFSFKSKSRDYESESHCKVVYVFKPLTQVLHFKQRCIYSAMYIYTVSLCGGNVWLKGQKARMQLKYALLCMCWGIQEIYRILRLEHKQSSALLWSRGWYLTSSGLISVKLVQIFLAIRGRILLANPSLLQKHTNSHHLQPYFSTN